MPYPLNQVLAKTLDRNFDEKYNVHAVLEILKHPEKYINIYNIIYFGAGLLQDYEYYFCEEKHGEKPEAPDSSDEEAWLGLLEKDMTWLESLDASKISCTFFDGLVEHFDRDDWVPDIPKNVMDAYYEDLKELYSAFATVSGEHQGEQSSVRNPRKLNCVINDYLGANYGDKDNIYAVMEILCHPKKYPHIENTIGVENLTFLDTAYEEFVRDGKSDVYPKDTKAEDIDLDDLSVRMRDKAWLEKLEKANITSEFFYSMAQLIAGMLDPSVPDNVQDAFDQDIKELYEAFDTVSDYRFPDAWKLF